MGIRNVQDPYGGRTGLVDKLIGNAFDIVYLVARHINEIKYLVSNMEAIIIVAKNLPDTTNVTVTGKLGSLGQSVEFTFPTGITMANLVSSTVLVIDSEGNAYQHSNGNFYFWYKAGKLRVTLMPDAPISMIDAVVRWNITYRIR